jgi:hypothetical protein
MDINTFINQYKMPSRAIYHQARLRSQGPCLSSLVRARYFKVWGFQQNTQYKSWNGSLRQLSCKLDNRRIRARFLAGARDSSLLHSVQRRSEAHPASCSIGKDKGKATPLQALTSPEGLKRLRLPEFKTIGTWRCKGCQPYAPAAFTPRKYSWYSFLLEAESTPGP